MLYQPRFYRHKFLPKNLEKCCIAIKETDLCIYATRILEREAQKAIQTCRSVIETYISLHPEFKTSMEPLPVSCSAHQLIQDMILAGIQAHVGPMAAVAGAIAEYVANDLMTYDIQEIIVENGGDIFIHVNRPLTIGIYAGESPLSFKIGVEYKNFNHPYAVCTSSGTVGHSYSYGKADAVCVIARSGALADASATAIGNRVQTKQDIESAVQFGKTIQGVCAILIIKNKEMGLWGDIEVVKIK
ncbi:MAG: UPF0280 family protein [Desulfobacterales bacterium]|nr:UPF0280 family protein [Desulfobacterales bacterium]